MEENKIGWGCICNKSNNITKRKRMDNGDGSIKERYLILVINTQVANMWHLQHSAPCGNAFGHKTDNVYMWFCYVRISSLKYMVLTINFCKMESNLQTSTGFKIFLRANISAVRINSNSFRSAQFVNLMREGRGF